ncbi:MAG: DUF2934 domain-containing protein [Nevskia sp.]|nr:DUF2934 domain-containing protein [Nevskia sp.]
MSEDQIDQQSGHPSAGDKSPGNWAERESRIARAAYFRAQQRGFAPGHEVEDWLAAEAEVDRRDLKA